MEEKNQVLSVEVKPGKDGKVFIGNDFHILKDETKGQFKTSSLMDFIAYLEKNKKANVFYDDEGCTAFESLTPKFTDKAVAVCGFERTKIIDFLRQTENRKLSVSEFEDFLRVVRNYITGDAIKIMDFLENVQISKVKTVRRQSDNSGNFAYSVSSDKGANDFAFPKQILFKVPILKHLPVEKEIPFDFFFSWEEQEEKVSFKFQIRNLNLDDLIETAINETVLKTLSAAGLSVRYGDFNVIKDTDEWTYKENKLKIENS